jgi:serine/threonine-protein kinase
MLLDYTTQLANGLARANASGIIHDALMPENLMVTSGESLKIFDFGLNGLIQDTLNAELVKDITYTETILGSMAYMSPEQVSGRKVSFRSDQFSLGAIVYEMAGGRAAFQRGTASETIKAIIENEPEPLNHLNPDVTSQLPAIVARCLDKRPDARYGSTQELAKELMSIPEAPSSFTTLMKMLRKGLK